MGDIDGLLVGKNRGFDITCLPHVGEIEIVRDQIPTSAPPTPYWGGWGVGLCIDRCIMPHYPPYGQIAGNIGALTEGGCPCSRAFDYL